MAKLTLEDLRKIREEKKKEMSRRTVKNAKAEITIGMGTCGIASGAKNTFEAIISELSDNGIYDVVVKQFGCLGCCNEEPLVKVKLSDSSAIVYGKVSAEVGRKIVTEHIMQGKIVNEFVLDNNSAANVLKGGE